MADTHADADADADPDADADADADAGGDKPPEMPLRPFEFLHADSDSKLGSATRTPNTGLLTIIHRNRCDARAQHRTCTRHDDLLQTVNL